MPKPPRTILVAAVALLGAIGWSPATRAAPAWPATVAGTWTADGNNYPDHTLKFTQPNSSARCKQITGTLEYPGQPIQPLAGFYCPQSGRIVFSRRYGDETIQVWSGQLSQPKGSGTPVMTGLLASLRQSGGDAGEYPFFASRNN